MGGGVDSGSEAAPVAAPGVAPASVDVQMLPAMTTAASFVPSDDEVIEVQVLVAPTDVSSVKVALAMHIAVRKRNLRIMMIRVCQDLR